MNRSIGKQWDWGRAKTLEDNVRQQIKDFEDLCYQRGFDDETVKNRLEDWKKNNYLNVKLRCQKLDETADESEEESEDKKYAYSQGVSY